MCWHRSAHGRRRWPRNVLPIFQNGHQRRSRLHPGCALSASEATGESPEQHGDSPLRQAVSVSSRCSARIPVTHPRDSKSILKTLVGIYRQEVKRTFLLWREKRRQVEERQGGLGPVGGPLRTGGWVVLADSFPLPLGAAPPTLGQSQAAGFSRRSKT